MFSKSKIITAIAVLVASLALVGSASASSNRAAYGQCGPQVHSGAQLLNAWGGMQVLNSQSAQRIAKKAGWSSTDGQLTTFITQRGREFQLAKAANVEDFGCKVGSMYSVGQRHYGAGERVIAIVPSQYAPSQVSSTPRAGFTKKVVQVWTVGRGSCANGFSAHVWVVMYVKHGKTPKAVHKTKTTKPAAKPVPAACVTVSGSPLYAPLPAGINVLNGVCTAVTNTTTVKSCDGNDVPIKDSQGVVINCITNTNVNNNTTTVVTPPITVVVNPPATTTPPCNCTTPTPPVTTTPCNCSTPPPAASVTITSYTQLNMINAGKTSAQAPFIVNASQAGGSVTVDPGRGGISDCNGGPELQTAITFTLNAGNNNLCVIFYAPDDADKPATNTVTYTATCGSAVSIKTDTYSIKYPTRA